MEIDLSLLHSQTVAEIDISGKYTLPKEYFENTSLLEAKDLKVRGKIYQNSDEEDFDTLEDYVQVEIKGTLTLEDSISLEPISYPILIEYDDILEENFIPEFAASRAMAKDTATFFRSCSIRKTEWCREEPLLKADKSSIRLHMNFMSSMV